MSPNDQLDAILNVAYPEITLGEFVQLLPPGYWSHPHLCMIHRCVLIQREKNIKRFKYCVLEEISKINSSKELISMADVLKLLENLDMRLDEAICATATA